MKKDLVSKKPTMKDVANLAGVTIGTVSHVINGTAPITEKTKKKVRSAIKKLNYKPNSMARGLRRSESKMIGLLVPDITNEFYSLISRQFTDLAYAEGYTVMLCSFQYNREREALELDVLLDKSVDAIVLVGGSDDLELLENVHNLDVPIVLGDRKIVKNEYATVEFNNKSAISEAVKYLKQKGYSRMGYVSEALSMTNLQERYDGFTEGLVANGLTVDPNLIFIEKKLQLNKITNSSELVSQLLRERDKSELPEVFFASSDLVAIGIIKAIRAAGYEVPGDFGVVGFDDISIAPFYDPALTTISQEPTKLGSALWDTVFRLLTKETDYSSHLVLPQKFTVRDST